MAIKMNVIPADKLHEWANLIVGFNLPRAWVRRLSPAKRLKLADYVNYVWLTANDNYIPLRDRVKRPAWMPRKYC